MTGIDRMVIDSCHQLASGDAIEAFHGNTLVHRGPVTGTLPDQGLFWILDTLTGGRRLLDISGLEVVRIAPQYREIRVDA
ncbi:hypothetical protein [Pseudarthrobacter sp. NamE2]|uniref:hypothetical protein n=1 Tax=Pseudarthrobacter sp. NamE2 TaxID=2576838 RepID=UPI001F0D8B88|nr:hypothetical protein [Pseudarthrobacter sp. NamE2]